jgi:hypothetical protein
MPVSITYAVMLDAVVLYVYVRDSGRLTWSIRSIPHGWPELSIGCVVAAV